MKITRIGAAGGEVLLAGQGDQTLLRASRPPAPPSVTSTPFVVEATSTRTPPMFCCRLWSVGLKSNNRIAQKAVNLLAAVKMTTITDMVARGWENFVARPRGPLNLRFIIQPTLASIIALRAGLKDLRIPIVVGTTLDVVYQIIIHRWIYPLELLFTVTLLVLVPYLILRGLVNRIASRFVSGGGADAAGKDSGQQSKTIT